MANQKNQAGCAKDDVLACRKGKIGGEAVLEGIMMKAGGTYSIALRRESDHRIRISDHKYTSLRDRYRLLRLPIVRGVVNLVESLLLSYRSLGSLPRNTVLRRRRSPAALSAGLSAASDRIWSISS